MKKSKQNSQFMVLLFAALALLIGIFLVTKPVRYQTEAGRMEETYTKIQSADDLERALKSLQDTNFDSIDEVVSQNEEEASDY